MKIQEKDAEELKDNRRDSNGSEGRRKQQNRNVKKQYYRLTVFSNTDLRAEKSKKLLIPTCR